MKLLTREAVEKSSSLYQLLLAVLDSPGVWGRRSNFSPEDIAVQVIRVIQGKTKPDRVTRAFGLREKAIELRDRKDRILIDWFLLEAGSPNTIESDWPLISECYIFFTPKEAESRIGGCTATNKSTESIEWIRSMMATAKFKPR